MAPARISYPCTRTTTPANAAATKQRHFSNHLYINILLSTQSCTYLVRRVWYMCYKIPSDSRREVRYTFEMILFMRAQPPRDVIEQ
jgi:hypothetical protein